MCFLFSDLEGILDQLGKSPNLVNEAVLISCTEQNVAQFSLDVGKGVGLCFSKPKSLIKEDRNKKQSYWLT